MSEADLASTLHRLADAADALTLAPWQAGSVVAENKADGSVVTAIDSAVERELRSSIASLYPDDGFLGEEVGASPGTSGRTWIVDGIDGTRFYARGDHAWSTLVSLVVDGTAVAGMVTSPALGRRWWNGSLGPAVVSGGEERPLAVSNHDSLADASVCVWPWEGEPREMFRSRWRELGTWPSQEQLRPSEDIAVPNGALLVADGRADAFVMFGGQAWDHAANVAIVRAAGGRFSCLDGSDAMTTGAGVYSNAMVHDALLDQLATSPKRPAS